MWWLLLSSAVLADPVEDAWRAEGLEPPQAVVPPELIQRFEPGLRLVEWGPGRIALASNADPLFVVDLVDDTELPDDPGGLAATLVTHGITRVDHAEWSRPNRGSPGGVALRPTWRPQGWELVAEHPHRGCGKVVHASQDVARPLWTVEHPQEPRMAVIVVTGRTLGVVGVHLESGYGQSPGTVTVPLDRGYVLSLELQAGWERLDPTADGVLLVENTCAYSGDDMAPEFRRTDKLAVRVVPGVTYDRPRPWQNERWTEVVETPMQLGGHEATRLDWVITGTEANNLHCTRWELGVWGLESVVALDTCTASADQSQGGRGEGQRRQDRTRAVVETLKIREVHPDSPQ